MDLELTDKVAVVTGGNKGIGLAITKALIDEGAVVVAGSLSTENLDGLDRVTAISVNLAEATDRRCLCGGRSTTTGVSTYDVACFQQTQH